MDIMFTLNMKNKITLAIACALSTTAFHGQAAQWQGKVLDKAGNPVAKAEVSLDSFNKKVFTDANGVFNLSIKDEALASRFSPEDIATIEVHVNAPGFVHQTLFLAHDEKNQQTVTLLPSSIEIIDVHASPFHSSVIESALPVSVIANDALRDAQQSTLGDTLNKQVGVHTNFYGGVASSPIIRGLDGPRVLVSQNGLDAGDASRVGPDHVVATEVATAQQIEILRGPATLFFGSGAIGGVVNIVDQRVPNELEKTAQVQASTATVNDEQNLSFVGQTFVNDWAFYADAFWRDSANYDIPGMAELHEEHEEHDEHEAESGTVANSASESSGFTLGSSYILDNGFIGFSLGRLDREYGIPGHSHGAHDEHADEHEGAEHEEHSAEEVTAKMEQTRVQVLSEYQFTRGLLEAIHAKAAFTDYEHAEIEEGMVGTQFTNDTAEVRVEFLHRPIAGWKGGLSVHYKNSEFAAVGAEAFTPPAQTETLALAILEEKHVGDVLWQLGARIEDVSIDSNLLTSDESVSLGYQPVSVSAGFVWDFAEGYNIGTSVSYAQRALSATEIFAYGPHISTQTFEVGSFYVAEEHEETHLEFSLADTEPKLETSRNLDLTLRKFSGDVGFVVNLFYNQIDNYAAATDTGFIFGEGEHHDNEHVMDEADHSDEDYDNVHDEHGEHDHGGEGLPIYLFTQQDAELYGIETEVHWQVNNDWKVSVQGDLLRAKYADGSYIPRTPPSRLGTDVSYMADKWDAALSVQRIFSQEKIAATETVTAGYTMVDAKFSYQLDMGNMDWTVYLQGKNLLDEEARVHTSVLKNLTPLPGRNFKLGIRGSF